MEILDVPQGEFRINRYPVRKNELLRAWDAADEYLLNYFHDEFEPDKNSNILIINDNFGALATSLADHNVMVWTDSWISMKGIQQNLIANEIPVNNIEIKNSIETPAGRYEFVLIKIPKSLALLEDQLIRINPFISSATIVVAAGMAKSIHNSTLALFEKYIGLTKTSLARKKARLIFSKVDDQIKAIKSPYPESYILEGTDYTIINHANVFSRGRLDIGTRFFVQHIPQSGKYKNIIDLACGNGVVGLMALEKNPAAEILFLDESFMAMESARVNIKKNVAKNEKIHFDVKDCLSEVKHNSVELILNNPPFHQNNAVGDAIAWQMFKQSKDVLKEGGELWVIGNQHLGYHTKLKKIFKNCEIIATNKKFVILKAINKR